MVAGVEMIRRTGADWFQIRYQDDEEPTVWVAVGCWAGDLHEVAGALDPTRAILRLCEQVIDGGTCTHCSRPTAFDADHIDSPAAPFDQLACWYQFDPELATFRRGCA